MCGRFALYSSHERIAKLFAIKQAMCLGASYNIAPTENISVICGLPEGERALVSMRWGLIPSWQTRPNLSSALINARLESIGSKPSFRLAARTRRCLIITDGFFEWHRSSEKIRQPYFVRQKNEQPFALAGIWERWIGENNSIDSCCIITLAANELLLPLHDRMPAIVMPENYNTWLDPEKQDWKEARKLLTDEPHMNLTFYKVSMKINSSKYKNDDCVRPV